MGRYIAVEDLVNEIPEAIQALTTNDTLTGENAVNGILEDRISVAEGMFEGYVSERYAVPYLMNDGTAPSLVKQIVITIVKYLLYSRRNALTPDIQAQYDSAISYLVKVNNGKANLPKIDASGNLEEPVQPVLMTSGYKKPNFDDWI